MIKYEKIVISKKLIEFKKSMKLSKMLVGVCISSCVNLLAQTPLLAATFGVTANEIITELSTNPNFIGRQSGSTKEADTADYLEGLFNNYGLATTVQPFSYERNGTTFNSQNIIAEKTGTSGLQIILGAHYDTRPSSSSIDRSSLQGTNDNASGVGLLMELAEAVNSLPTEHTIKFIAFGSEEVGLIGSEYYASNMSNGEINSTLYMANFDSIVFGDFMYFNAGLPAAVDDRPSWGFVRDMALDIASDLGIEAYTNPGLNPDYPAGTGCCSDHESFEQLMPILGAESTNWSIGDLDGYTQTTSPLVPGGATWHDPTYDNLDFISTNFSDWLNERPRDYSQIMQTLLVESNALDSTLQQVPESNMILGMAIVFGFAFKYKSRTNNHLNSNDENL